MDINDEKLLQEMIKEYQKQYFKNIEEDVISSFKEALNETIYNYYSPVEYKRTYMFRDSVKCHFDSKENILYVYSDINTGYYSAVDGRDVAPAVGWWLEEGHSDGIGEAGINTNQYHQFEGRHFLEKAEEILRRKYPELKVTIINDEPIGV